MHFNYKYIRGNLNRVYVLCMCIIHIYKYKGLCIRHNYVFMHKLLARGCAKAITILNEQMADLSTIVNTTTLFLIYLNINSN